VHVHSDATRRDDRQHDSTHGTDKLACSQSQSPVTLNRDTIVPDFVILANPLNSCALTRLSTSRPGGSSNVLLRRWLRPWLSVPMLRRRSALCADHLFTTALSPPLSHQWMATRPVVISYLALPGRHPSQKFVQHPSRRHARVLPETIGTAVTLNVVKCLERASPHLRTTLLPERALKRRRLGMPAIDHHESRMIDSDSAYTRHTSVCQCQRFRPPTLPTFRHSTIHATRFSPCFRDLRSPA
jgi:hypothetical protein